MDIPIHYRDSPHSQLRSCVHDSDRDVPEDAIPAATIRLGMMTRRPHQRVSIFYRAGNDSLDRADHTTRGELRDFEATGAEGGEFTCFAAALGGQTLYLRNVFASMEA